MTLKPPPFILQVTPLHPHSPIPLLIRAYDWQKYIVKILIYLLEKHLRMQRVTLWLCGTECVQDVNVYVLGTKGLIFFYLKPDVNT